MKDKNVINVLIAVPERDSRAFTELLKETMKENQYFQVLHFYTVHNLPQIDSYIEQRKVDVVICAEDLGDDNKIGQGSIKRWKQYDEHVKIVMILFDEKRKGTKVSNFLKAEYYDAIFFSDLSPEMLIDIIVNGRTAEEASNYYFSDATVLQSLSQIDNELLESEDEVQEEEVTVSADENIEEILIEESAEDNNMLQSRQEQNEIVEEDNKRQVMPEEVNSSKEKEEREVKEKPVLPKKQMEKKEKKEPFVRTINNVVPVSSHGIDTYMGSIKATVDTKGILLSLDSALDDIGELEGCRVLINIFRE